MAQARVHRRRPCTKCGGRYFAGTMGIIPTLVAIAAALGGFAVAILSTSALWSAKSGDVPQSGNAMSGAVWAIGGIVVAGIVAAVSHGYRCIQCDTKQ